MTGVQTCALPISDPPLAVLLKFTAVVEVPLHNTWFGTGFTVTPDDGLTVMVKLVGVPTQLTAPLV